MAERTDRIEARVEPARAERIRQAAALAHTSVSAFVIEAAFERAEEIIARERETVVPSDFFDSLLQALDEPPEVVPVLKRAVERAAETVRRR